MRNGAVLDGRYRIEQKLAEGGFGAIYRATDLVMGREVALKVLHSEIADDASVVERFRREAGALARLRDPHTITMYDVGHSADGTRYIVMELLRGESLYTLFTRHGRLPWQRVAAIARGVCSSLREAHAFQIIHRDLKPANIHLERHALEADYVKVLDFGIAKMLDASDVMNPALTIAGQLVGTYDYMSPEQMLGGSCNGRSDVFALGVIIYEMITGVRPYGADANGPASMLMALLGTEPALMSSHVDVPPALDRVVMKALAQDPKDRLDVDDLDEALAFILDAARGLALGTMDVPASGSIDVPAASSSSLDVARGSALDLEESQLDYGDDATWIDQAPPRIASATPHDTPTTFGPPPQRDPMFGPRDTPTTFSAIPSRTTPTGETSARTTPTTVPTLIGTPAETPSRTTPTTAPTLIGTPATLRTPPHGVPLTAAASIAPLRQVQRKTPLRGTPPPELQRKVSSGPGRAKPANATADAHAKVEANATADGRAKSATNATADAHAKTQAHDTQTEERSRDHDDNISRDPTPAGLPARRTPPRGTPPMPTGKPPRGGMKTSASSDDFTRIETPRGLATGTTRPPSKAGDSFGLPGMPLPASGPSSKTPVSPVGPTASIEQAIAEEIEHAVDAMVIAPPKAEVSLPRPGSPAQVGIWPAPERIRPLTVRFAVGSGTELPSLETAAAKVPLAVPVRESVQPAAPVTESVAEPRRSSAVRYVVWALALFGVGFAAALGISAL
ncbi:MAG: protein kinase [Kofleriaceae bacterium]|nr:protein kinase [Kofleriaceae bacterium]